MARHCKHFWRSVGLALGLAAPAYAPARAYEEQASLDGSIAYTLLVPDAVLPMHGAALDLGAGLGLGDVAILRGSLGYALLRDGETPARHAGRLRVEALYLLDVLQVVPFFGAGASLIATRPSDEAFRVLPAGHLLLGVDYLASRRWIVGLDVRTGVVVEEGRVRSATEVALRISRMFELF